MVHTHDKDGGGQVSEEGYEYESQVERMIQTERKAVKDLE